VNRSIVVRDENSKADPNRINKVYDIFNLYFNK
jgi:hypothetical protein